MELVVIKYFNNLDQFFSKLPKGVAPNCNYVLWHTSIHNLFPFEIVIPSSFI
ncbi:hypothetical protein Pst134EA_029425 [Puccinia striiformis f. sp. tritici]|uniref:hypothetical protein n=1 Tax=Puccinia striiformis f. sp. tritici TaxID=168172 RepID=UPI00200788D4|nr:hypothetical protein Pst134EA_029425 [Puccinia striiformis f. sp. tritici]KAH9441413.1 hypothetical protein Pst134EB_030078 [Puccinia striiformis f. sp. tritici]KAH9447385.1 hypothetical protein Pst134EA_029425 [Puccinia striiformis f. sp. tritici]